MERNPNASVSNENTQNKYCDALYTASLQPIGRTVLEKSGSYYQF